MEYTIVGLTSCVGVLLDHRYYHCNTSTAHPDMQSFTIIAHRGDSSTAPENTLAAFDRALQQHFPHFETDCQLSSDGIVVIVHDEQLGRVNNGTGAVSDHTLEQLKQLDAGSWFDTAFAGLRVPTLGELLDRYCGRAHIHLVSYHSVNSRPLG